MSPLGESHNVLGEGLKHWLVPTRWDHPGKVEQLFSCKKGNSCDVKG